MRHPDLSSVFLFKARPSQTWQRKTCLAWVCFPPLYWNFTGFTCGGQIQHDSPYKHSCNRLPGYPTECREYNRDMGMWRVITHAHTRQRQHCAPGNCFVDDLMPFKVSIAHRGQSVESGMGIGILRRLEKKKASFPSRSGGRWPAQITHIYTCCTYQEEIRFFLFRPKGLHIKHRIGATAHVSKPGGQLLQRLFSVVKCDVLDAEHAW